MAYYINQIGNASSSCHLNDQNEQYKQKDFEYVNVDCIGSRCIKRV